MCGRFTSLVSPELLADIFDVPVPATVEPRFNIAPTQQVLIVRETDKGRLLTPVRWGQLPSWPNDAVIGTKAVNTDAENLTARPPRADCRLYPCLLPANGFYVWQHSGNKCQPWYITRKDGAPVGFAGLLEPWCTPNGDCIETCTIITMCANDIVRPLHDRMPVMVEPDFFSAWLSAPLPFPSRLLAMLNPRPSGLLHAYPVRPVVNSPACDTADCIAPIHSR